MKSALWAYVSVAALTLGLIGGCGSDDDDTTANKCDGVSCMHGSCNASTGTCDCEGAFAGDTCSECASGFYAQGDACLPNQCEYAAQCSDGIACNGEELCTNGTCQAAAPVMCGDHGTCQEPDGSCACEGGYHNTGTGCLADECATAADCDDGLVCNGEEKCIANKCEFGYPTTCGSHGTCQEPDATCDCDDGYHLVGTACLKDACTTAEECDDGLVCNGEETCDGGNCALGTEVTCGENSTCTEPDATCTCDEGFVDDEGTCVAELAIIGSYTDDLDFSHEVTQIDWTMSGATGTDPSVFHISQYDNDTEFLVAQNDSANPYNADLWSRIDWTYDGTDLYFCQIAFDAADEATAAAVVTADRTDLAAGCATYAWAKLTPVTP